MPRLLSFVFLIISSLLPFIGYTRETVEFPSMSPSKPVTVRAELYRPQGQGPFPAVVVLHSCGGVGSRDNTTAARLQAQGYVALVPDTFYARGFDRCERGNFPNHVMDQVHDTRGAASYLRSRLLQWSIQFERSMYGQPGSGMSVPVQWCKNQWVCRNWRDIFLIRVDETRESAGASLRTCHPSPWNSRNGTGAKTKSFVVPVSVHSYSTPRISQRN